MSYAGKRCALVMVVILAALAQPQSSEAQVDMRVRIGRCSSRAGDLERLACYDSLARTLGFGRTAVSVRTAGSGRWRTLQDRNPLDDTPTVALSLAATTGRSRFGDPVMLSVRCRSHEVEVYIDWASYLGMEETRVTSRVGSDDAKAESWSISTNNQATFFQGDGVALIQRLATESRFVAQVTPYNESPITAVFEVAGLQAALSAFRVACPQVATP